ncbi:Pyridoxine/pyridoxamine 5'-phosphate oxidase [Lucilia cuprina]|nr:Pyridoxine/pyridoxamine 5'-phosphate oxidase [Lucilia cuprina]
MAMLSNSHLAKITKAAPHPVQMFQTIIDKVKPQLLVMNLATQDNAYGVLNRSVVYRGLSQDEPTPHICFVTEKNSHKYQTLRENPKVAVTILCSIPDIELWQIRLFNAEAVEIIDKEILNKFWQEEPLYAKIRSHICECGKPNDGEELDRKYQEILELYERESIEPEQTKSYTAFKIIPKIWDFYKSEPNKIADRVQYKLIEGETDKWQVYHVDA